MSMNILNYVKKKQLALEAIEFQNGEFFNELTKCCEILADKKVDRKKVNIARDDIKECIKKYTSINFKVIVTGSIGFACNIDIIDENHPFTRNWVDMLDVFDISKLSTKDSIVDLKNAKLSGGFTEIPVNLYLDTNFFGGSLSAPEMAAIILHEVGHIFTYFELMTQIQTINQVMSDMSKKLNTTESPAVRKIIIEQAAKKLNLKDKVVTIAKNAPKDEVIYTVLIGASVQELKTQEGYSFYDQNTWEMMADQFAMRCGAGSYLATGLSTILRRYGVTGASEYIGNIYSNIFTVLSAILIPVGSYIAIASGAIPLLFGIIVLAICMGSGIYSLPDNTYDKTTDRFKRMRNQLVQRLKNPDLDEVMKNQIIVNIACIDKLVNEYGNQPVNFIEFIGKFLFSYKRNSLDSASFQRTLEDLSNNNLFILGNKLKHNL